MSSKLSLFILLQLVAFVAFSQKKQLRQAIEDITKEKKAEIGVAVLDLGSRDTLSLYGKKHFPMQSVYKFHPSF